MKTKISEHFESRFWQEAINRYKKLHKIHGDSIRLLLTEHWVTSGYWIETTRESIIDESVVSHYDSLKEVEAFEKRLQDAFTKAEKKNGYTPMAVALVV